jgi:hypothetical protein
MKQHACPSLVWFREDSNNADQLLAPRFTSKSASAYVERTIPNDSEHPVIDIRKGQSNWCCILADHLRRTWSRRFRHVRLCFKSLQKTSLTSTRYNGTSDLQLERMNVYFNEV